MYKLSKKRAALGGEGGGAKSSKTGNFNASQAKGVCMEEIFSEIGEGGGRKKGLPRVKNGSTVPDAGGDASKRGVAVGRCSVPKKNALQGGEQEKNCRPMISGEQRTEQTW